jgi:hypothetical protein
MQQGLLTSFPAEIGAEKEIRWQLLVAQRMLSDKTMP